MAKPPKKQDDPTKDDFEFGAEIEPAEEDTTKTENHADDLSTELTEAEKVKLEAEARVEVARAIKLAKLKDFKAAAKKRIQAEAFFSEGKDATGKDLATVHLDLASYPKWIMLDGKRYHSGRSYRVSRPVASVLLDQMHRGWQQEEARLGERTDFAEHKQKILDRRGLREVAVVH